LLTWPSCKAPGPYYVLLNECHVRLLKFFHIAEYARTWLLVSIVAGYTSWPRWPEQQFATHRADHFSHLSQMTAPGWCASVARLLRTDCFPHRGHWKPAHCRQELAESTRLACNVLLIRVKDRKRSNLEDQRTGLNVWDAADAVKEKLDN